MIPFMSHHVTDAALKLQPFITTSGINLYTSSVSLCLFDPPVTLKDMNLAFGHIIDAIHGGNPRKKKPLVPLKMGAWRPGIDLNLIV